MMGEGQQCYRINTQTDNFKNTLSDFNCFVVCICLGNFTLPPKVQLNVYENIF